MNVNDSYSAMRSNNSNTNNNDILQKILIKENETLKRVSKNKIEANETFGSLMSVLEMQRERIAILEEGKLSCL